MRVTYTDEEYAQLVVFAARQRLAVGAYVAEASLTAAAPPARRGELDADVRELLVALMDIHRQLRGACNNLNQAVRALHSTGELPAELPAVADYVRRVTTTVDSAVAGIARRADP